MNWSRERFLEVLASAHHAERSWVDERRGEGLSVAHGKKIVLPNHNPRTDHCPNPDSVGAVQIELKLRNLTFTEPGDWPHGTVFVDDLNGLAKGTTPFAWVYLSQKTGEWVWLCVLDRDEHWKEQVIWDGMRKFNVPTLVAPKRYLRHADELRAILLPQQLLQCIEGPAAAFRGAVVEGEGGAADDRPPEPAKQRGRPNVKADKQPPRTARTRNRQADIDLG